MLNLVTFMLWARRYADYDKYNVTAIMAFKLYETKEACILSQLTLLTHSFILISGKLEKFTVGDKSNGLDRGYQKILSFSICTIISKKI